MSRVLAVGLLLVLACLTPVATGGSTADPRIVGVLANPVASEDAGEFVVVSLPNAVANGTLALGDGEETVSLPALPAGRVTLATEPGRVPGHHRRVVGLDGDLSLSNAGERLTLRRDGTAVSTVNYTDAAEGDLLDLRGDRDRWHPLGATDLSITAAGAGSVRAFLLPDAPNVPRTLLAGARDRILLGGYTFASNRTADLLVAAARRGVTVEVLLDADPVGGMSRLEATLLDRLVAAGVQVRVLGGPVPRYDFHHPKYAVVDDAALVTSENWKPSGIGGAGNRGWGVVTRQETVVAGLAAVFRADASGRDAIDWANRSVEGGLPTRQPASGSYPQTTAPATLSVNRTRLLVAPDNAERAVVAAIDNATESVRVLQVGIGSRSQPFLRATLRAARRGVDVKVLLSGAWYAEAENRDLVEYLRARARRDDLPIEARLAEAGPRFDSVHAKGLVLDGDEVVLGSLNWNNNSARDNREVALALSGDAVGQYFARAFAADWAQTGWLLGLGVGLAALVAALLAVFRARRIDFAAR